ncbi:hypothetical protein WNY37_12650 [Henriciella sp. AS95]|uniref:hypothetical protein n=1 Tax=Henriciella sp. AS95 TaxID=3135782 RepID=UPI003180AB9A
MKQTLFLSAAALLLASACTSTSPDSTTGKVVSQTRSGMADAAMTPLEDLNLKRDQIPAVLAEIKNPYEVSTDISCEDIAAQVTALDAVLGPDFDAPKQTDDSTLSDKAAGATSDGILKAVASEAGGLIPYRSWVRQLSGAKRHEAKIKRAINKGTHRRTYLKALGQMKKCEGVAAPNLAAIKRDQTVVYRGDAPDGYAPQPKAVETQPEPPARDMGLVPSDIDSYGLDDVDGHTKADRKAKTASETTSYPPIED